MGRVYPLRFTIAVILLQQVVASLSVNDEFSNNLVSDLAPLLALFGEQVAKQFMSESMGWADHIIFAMAPLGILTAIVGAIRVGGLSWLKAIIGRARENRAVAEVELMSSTSHEVCELWNGQQIVRTMGSPPVKEILLFSACPNPPTEDNDYSFYSREEAVHDKRLVEVGGDYQRKDSHNDTEEQNPGDKPPIRGDYAPNISLNLHNRVGGTEIRIVAVIAVVLQSGILFYGGFATYHPKLKYPKGDLAVEGYAFPVLALGTVILSAGLLICAHVIESSTKEKMYQVPADQPGTQLHVLWLQKAERVADQSFESFAIFSKDTRKVITTSQRKEGWDDEGSSVQLVTGVSVTVGTIITLCGFFLQFTGLRGMHWSVSLAQLGGTLVMAILRAYVRRGLTQLPHVQRLPLGYELDWLATRSSGLNHWPRSTPHGKRFRIPISCSWSKPLKTQNPPVEDESEKVFWSEGWDPCWSGARASNPGSGEDPKLLNELKDIRVRLGTLTGWHSHALAEAQSVAAAIDIVLNTLSHPLQEDFCWSLPIRALGGQDANVTSRKSNGKWETNVDEIEAMLSLWLYASHRKEELTQSAKYPKGFPQEDGNSGQKRLENQSIRLLGSNTLSLRRDLRWWVDEGSARILVAKEVCEESTERASQKVEGQGSGQEEDEEEGEEGGEENEKIKIESHRVVGRGEIKNKHSPIEFVVREVPEVFQLQGGAQSLLVALSDAPLALLFAQDIFSAFMWAVSERLTTPINGKAIVRHMDSANTNGSSWQCFTLHHPKLSKMAQDIQRTGLGPLQEVYLSIIPPLSAQGYLPDVSAIVELARGQAESHELRNHWQRSADIYLWLFRTSRSFDPSTFIAHKATAVLVEFFRSVIIAAKTSVHQDPDEGPMTMELLKVRSVLKVETEKSGGDYFSSLMKLLSVQKRILGHDNLELDWTPLVVYDDYIFDEPQQGELDEFQVGFKYLHYHSLNGNSWEVSQAIRAGPGNADILGFSPLHYAAGNGQSETVMRLLEAGADGNARDLAGWTPLHYCSSRYNEVTFTYLLQDGVDIEVRGRDGTTPLHCAAICNSHEAARLLIEAGASTEVLDASRNTPLHWAAYYGHCEVIQILMEAGGVRVRNNAGRTPGHLAALAGKYAAFKLITKGVAREEKDRTRCTALHLAAAGGNEDLVRFLVGKTNDNGAPADTDEQHPPGSTSNSGSEVTIHPAAHIQADIEAQDIHGRQPLHRAARSTGAGIGRVLISSGADIEARDKDERTPLHASVRGANKELFWTLINAGADVYAKSKYGRTALHEASTKGLVWTLISTGVDIHTKDENEQTELYEASTGELVRILIKEGVNVDAKDDNGETPLHRACSEEDEGLVRILIKEGADVNAKGDGGETPLHKACLGKDVGLVRILIKEGADVNAKGYGGETPLHKACWLGNVGLVRILIKEGADVNAKDDGRTPLHIACLRKDVGLVRILIKGGADVNAKDEGGWTALHIGSTLGREDVVKLLVKEGADVDAKDNLGLTAQDYVN